MSMSEIGKKTYYGRTFKVYSRQDFESNDRKCPKCGGECDIESNIPLYLRSPKITETGENKKPDGSARCINCGYIFIIDLSGLEEIDFSDLKKIKFNKKEYYIISRKEWESIYKKCPLCKENCILHQKKDCENYYQCYFNEIQCQTGKDHVFMLTK